MGAARHGAAHLLGIALLAQHASATNNGCRCLQTWDYFGQWYYGCDARKPGFTQPWCVVDPDTCSRKPHPMSSMSTHGHVGGMARKLALSQTAHEHGDSWDLCSVTDEQLAEHVSPVTDPLHACPARTWNDVVFLQPGSGQEDPPTCAQLCFNPSLEIHDESLDILYGTTCIQEGFSTYKSTGSINRQVVHWYGQAPDTETARHAAAARRHERKMQHDPDHPCEENRMTDAIHISEVKDKGTSACSQICLNPSFQKPAEKHGVIFRTTCLDRGYSRFVREDKNMGQTIFVYLKPDDLDDADAAALELGGPEDKAPADLSSISQCPLVSNPDMSAREAMGVICRKDEEMDCSSLPSFLRILAGSQPPDSREAKTYELSANAMDYICDACTVALRPYITAGGTDDPPPSDVRAAVCASPTCAQRFQHFLSALNSTKHADLDALCALGDAEGNVAMGRVLDSLARSIETFMGTASPELWAEGAARAARSPAAAGARVFGGAAQLPAFLGVAACLLVLAAWASQGSTSSGSQHAQAPRPSGGRAQAAAGRDGGHRDWTWLWGGARTPGQGQRRVISGMV